LRARPQGKQTCHWQPEAQAQTAPTFETRAKQAILMDSGSGKVLFEKNADELMHPASMSKIMTMIMVFERLQSGRLSLDDEFLVSENAWRRGGATSGGSTMYAELNSRVRLEDLIKGVIVQSGNDASIIIAEGIAGSEAAFADMMTQRARELGLEQSTFRNATGLTDPEHQMTARELALLARYLIEVFPEYYKFYSIPEFTWNNITQATATRCSQLSRRRRHQDRLRLGLRLWPHRLGAARRAPADHGDQRLELGARARR
jgi:serine-type D-Ala-D-Ala carboxypeptidase (penicillin-binding protein 5/6)